MNAPQSRFGRRASLGALVVCLLVFTALSSDWDNGLLTHAQAHMRANATLDQRLAEFSAEAKGRLVAHFDAAGVSYPGQRVTMVAFKDSRRFELYAQDNGKPWRFIRAYPIRAASGVPGPKLMEGDRQVPEGHYRVTFLNPNSAFHVSLRLDYPNAHDRAMARADRRSQLGGDIMIHGNAVSVGCIAMGDEVAEELFTLAAAVGQAQIDVLIAPTDFRQPLVTTLPNEPTWVNQLYADLTTKLAKLPIPPNAPLSSTGE